MNRPLKFRVWDDVVKYYIPLKDLDRNFGLDFEGNLRCLISEREKREGFIFQQFTGLLDINKKEIYEGDILKRKSGFSNNYEIYECVFKINAALSEFILQNINRCWNYGGFSEDCEMVGNIFENPELLKN